jgi:hypothetical protein
LWSRLLQFTFARADRGCTGRPQDLTLAKVHVAGVVPYRTLHRFAVAKPVSAVSSRRYGSLMASRARRCRRFRAAGLVPDPATGGSRPRAPSTLPHHDFLEILLTGEVRRRDRQSALILAKTARPEPGMRLDAWDESTKVTYDRTLCAELTSLRFLAGSCNVLLMDRAGPGKRSWPTRRSTPRSAAATPSTPNAPHNATRAGTAESGQEAAIRPASPALVRHSRAATVVS